MGEWVCAPGYDVALRVFDVVHDVHMGILPAEFRYSSFHGYTLVQDLGNPEPMICQHWTTYHQNACKQKQAASNFDFMQLSVASGDWRALKSIGKGG